MICTRWKSWLRSKTGDLANLTSVNTNVHPGLVKAALDAVRQWRYKPATKNNVNVRMWVTARVRLTLR